MRQLTIMIAVLGACVLTASCTTTAPGGAAAPAAVAPPPPAPGAPAPAASAPVAPTATTASGAELTAKACGGCHGLDTVTSARNNLDGWRTVVSQMVDNGAPLNSQEAEVVSRYLAANYGL